MRIWFSQRFELATTSCIQACNSRVIDSSFQRLPSAAHGGNVHHSLHPLHSVVACWTSRPSLSTQPPARRPWLLSLQPGTMCVSCVLLLLLAMPSYRVFFLGATQYQLATPFQRIRLRRNQDISQPSRGHLWFFLMSLYSINTANFSIRQYSSIKPSSLFLFPRQLSVD